MQAVLRDPEFRLSAVGNVPEAELKQQYSVMLRELMNDMKTYLREMVPSSDTHREYVQFSQTIISHIRSYGSEICSVPPFFTSHSTHYWPRESDPNMYLPGLISYSLRLADEQSSHYELFHYLYNGWKNSIVLGQLAEHKKHIQEAMHNPYFFRFMATEMVPAIINAALETEAGWLICSMYLTILAKHTAKSLNLRGTDKTSTFCFSIHILKLALHGICMRCNSLDYLRQGVSWDERAIVTLLVQFWIFLSPYLLEYLRGHSSPATEIRNLLSDFDSFLNAGIRGFTIGCKDWFPTNLKADYLTHPGATELVRSFKNLIVDDIKENWALLPQSKLRLHIPGSRDGEDIVDIAAFEKDTPTLIEIILATKRDEIDLGVRMRRYIRYRL